MTDAEIEIPYPFFLVTAGQDADYLDLGLRLPLPDGGKQETNAFHDLVVIVDSDVIRADHQYYFLSLVSIQFTMIDSPKYVLDTVETISEIVEPSRTHDFLPCFHTSHGRSFGLSSPEMRDGIT